jgi:hypothetical protein
MCLLVHVNATPTVTLIRVDQILCVFYNDHLVHVADQMYLVQLYNPVSENIKFINSGQCSAAF